MGLCADCKSKGMLCSNMEGECKSGEKCLGDGTTSYSDDKYCEECSDSKNKCQHCGKMFIPVL